MRAVSLCSTTLFIFTSSLFSPRSTFCRLAWFDLLSPLGQTSRITPFKKLEVSLNLFKCPSCPMINLREAPYSLTQKETCFVLWLFQFNRPVRNANLTRVVSLLRYSSFSSILIQGTTNSFCALLLSISQTGR